MTSLTELIRRGKVKPRAPIKSQIPITVKTSLSNIPKPISGTSSLSVREKREEQEIMSVVLAQPHRMGTSSLPSLAWKLTALGKFCTIHWADDDAQYDNWRIGERYAQLIDADRIARGWPPRQCAATLSDGPVCTLQEAWDRRQRAANAILEANEEMGVVDRRAAGAIYRLAWEDCGIMDNLHDVARNALWRLSQHFERIDKPRK